MFLLANLTPSKAVFFCCKMHQILALQEEEVGVKTTWFFADSYAEIKGSSERHVKEGSELSLYCSINDISQTPSFVFWYRDGQVVNYSDQSGIRIVTKTDEEIAKQNQAVLVSSLHIGNVSPRDAGTYTCSPSNARNHSVVVHVIKGRFNLQAGAINLFTIVFFSR